jgi:hypothetical protein
MEQHHTDCRSEEGITVGLIDALITLARVLRSRDLSTDAIHGALVDLTHDEDLAYLLSRVDLGEANSGLSTTSAE